MEQQAGTGRPAGWYEVGSGWVAFWDGAAWTGDRTRPEQLRLTPPPPAVPPPPAGPVGPPRQRGWLLAAVIGGIILLGIMIAGAIAADGTNTERRPRTTTTAADTAAVFRDTANTLSEVCDSADSSRNGMTVAVPFGDEDCQQVVGLSLALFGFTSADYAKALAGHPVLSEGGGVEMTVIVASDGEVVTVRKVA